MLETRADAFSRTGLDIRVGDPAETISLQRPAEELRSRQFSHWADEVLLAIDTFKLDEQLAYCFQR